MKRETKNTKTIRISATDKQIIEKAAWIEQTSFSQFTAETALRKAKRVISKYKKENPGNGSI